MSYKYCYTSASSKPTPATFYGIDPKVKRSASLACQKHYGAARPTPLFDADGNPKCCGPIKVYNKGQLVEQCPPSGGGGSGGGGRGGDRDEEVDAQQAGQDNPRRN